MGWDWSARRASRTCLFPLKRLGAQYAADPEDAELNDREVCGAWDTDMEGLCPLHAGLPHTFMTPQAWAKVAEAIDHRRAAEDAVAQAKALTRQARREKRDAKADRWAALCRKVRDGEQINWDRVSREFRLQMAAADGLPEQTMRDLLAYAAWSPDQERDIHGDIRDTLAQRDDLADDLVRQLLLDDNAIVSCTAAGAQSLPDDDELIAGLLTHGSTLLAAIRNTTLPAVWLHRLTQHALDPASSFYVAMNSQAFREEMAEVDPYNGAYHHGLVTEQVVGWVLEHRNTSAKTLDRLAHHQRMSYSQLERIAAHPNTSSETLDFLATDSRKHVREAVAKRRAADATPSTAR